jgi:hypothetical protein
LIKLHGAMHTYLPTELRNMVYAYLLPIEDTVFFELPTYQPEFHDYDSGHIESDLWTTTRSFRAGTQDLDKPGSWLLNPAYVGKRMARDLAEIYYSSNKFSLEMRNLRGFFYEDRTDTGFKPIEFLRKKLSIQVETSMGNGQSERVWASTENEQEFLCRVYTNLRELLLLSYIPEIPIRIAIVTYSPRWEPQMEGERRFYNVMETVREPIYDLLHAGVNIRVQHIAANDHDCRVISEDPWNYFTIEKDKWHKEKRSHGTSWRPSCNFLTREDCQEDTLRRLLEQRWGHAKSIYSYVPS